MTLAVGLIVPDGVIIAADSLSTTQGKVTPFADIKSKCPHCEKEIELNKIPLPPFGVPISTQSYAQKVFTFGKKVGIATFGLGFIGNKTIYNHIKKLEFEKKVFENNKTIDDIIAIIIKYFEPIVDKEIKIPGEADNIFPLGFLLGAYDDNGEPMVIELKFGKCGDKRHILIEHDEIGCTVGGDISLVNSIWMGCKKMDKDIQIGVFSLQDAIDYADFLINFTSKYQRFLSMIPTVGGEVDILLITQYKEPIWIRDKRLNQILRGEVNND